MPRAMLMMWNNTCNVMWFGINARLIIHEIVVPKKKPNSRLALQITDFSSQMHLLKPRGWLVIINKAHFVLKVTYLKYFLCGI